MSSGVSNFMTVTERFDTLSPMHYVYACLDKYEKKKVNSIVFLFQISFTRVNCDFPEL